MRFSSFVVEVFKLDPLFLLYFCVLFLRKNKRILELITASVQTIATAIIIVLSFFGESDVRKGLSVVLKNS